MLSKDNKDQPLATKDASFDSVLHLAVNAAAVQREGKKKKKGLQGSGIFHFTSLKVPVNLTYLDVCMHTNCSRVYRLQLRTLTLQNKLISVVLFGTSHM